MYEFHNLDRVGYGPYAVGAYGPQMVGAMPYGPQIVGAAPYGAHMARPAMPGFGGPGGGGRGFGGPPGYAPGLDKYQHPALTPHPYSGSPVLQHIPPSQVREFIIGFGPTTVNASSTAIFQAQPQLLFRGSRLIIPSVIANNFVVNDIRVGKDSQAVSANPIPAAAFSELGVGVALGLDTASPGILITLSVANTTAGNQTFSAALIGTSMQ